MAARALAARLAAALSAARGVLGGVTVIDSPRALLVWEPKRIVPTYAFPEDDVDAEIAAATETGEPSEVDVPRLTGRPVLDPSVPFAVRSTAGEPVTIRSREDGQRAAGFRPADEALAGHVVVDFDGFDAWYEEDELNVAHPRDPYHRIDSVHSRRRVRVELDGIVLAESGEPCMLFEPPLPVRLYLPPRDVSTQLLVPSERTSLCAYKGRAIYWSLPDRPDVAWSYPEPLREAAELTGRYALFNEHTDITLDGAPLERPETPWSRR